MAKVVRVRSFKELGRLLKTSEREFKKKLKRAQVRAARRTAAHVRRNVPVAFGELRASVHSSKTKVFADAPHAAAVERGSRPHTPPLEPLIKWVRLRGMQGLVPPKSMARLPGTTTSTHASNVAGSIKQYAQDSGFADWSGGASPVDAPRQIARKIQAAIAKRGTKPHWYMRRSVPVARRILGEEITRQLKQK